MIDFIELINKYGISNEFKKEYENKYSKLLKVIPAEKQPSLGEAKNALLRNLQSEKFKNGAKKLNQSQTNEAQPVKPVQSGPSESQTPPASKVAFNPETVKAAEDRSKKRQAVLSQELHKLGQASPQDLEQYKSSSIANKLISYIKKILGLNSNKVAPAQARVKMDAPPNVSNYENISGVDLVKESKQTSRSDTLRGSSEVVAGFTRTASEQAVEFKQTKVVTVDPSVSETNRVVPGK